MATNLKLLTHKSTSGNTSRSIGDRWDDVINVKDYGATGNGSTDDTSSIQNAINQAITKTGGTVYFPVGNYKITSKLTFTSDPVNNKLVRLLGEKGEDVQGSRLTGNFADYMISSTDVASQSLYMIEKLCIVNSNAAGKGVQFNGLAQGGIRDCVIQASLSALVANLNSYNCTCINTQFIGIGAAAGSIGVVGAQSTFIGCSFTNWEVGLRVFNAGVLIEGNRFEVNKTAIQIGYDLSGASSEMNGCTVSANSFEQNDTSIYINAVGGLALIGNTITGTVSAYNGGTIVYGIRVAGNIDSGIVSGNTFGGTWSNSAILVANFNPNVVWSGNLLNNTGTGVNWSGPSAGLFASAPAAPFLGQTCWFSNSNTATFRATIAGGGSNLVLGMWNGTNWTVAG